MTRMDDSTEYVPEVHTSYRRRPGEAGERDPAGAGASTPEDRP